MARWPVSSVCSKRSLAQQLCRLKAAIFDSKPYTEQIFKERNQGRYALKLFEVRQKQDTTVMASGFKVICAFVNDRIDAGVVEELSRIGVEMIALRCAGYNNVDLKAGTKYRLSVSPVPAYSPLENIQEYESGKRGDQLTNGIYFKS